MMCRLPPCQLGALNAQNFVEQMNSCAKLVLGKKRTHLCHDLIDKLVVPRINWIFMDYCRKKGSITRVVAVKNDTGNVDTVLEVQF